MRNTETNKPYVSIRFIKIPIPWTNLFLTHVSMVGVIVHDVKQSGNCCNVRSSEQQSQSILQRRLQTCPGAACLLQLLPAAVIGHILRRAKHAGGANLQSGAHARAPGGRGGGDHAVKAQIRRRRSDCSTLQTADRKTSTATLKATEKAAATRAATRTRQRHCWYVGVALHARHAHACHMYILPCLHNESE